MKIRTNIKKLTIVSFSLLYLLYLVPIIYGQSGSTVSGYVFDPQRKPIVQVPVELMNDVDRVLQRTKTDNSGRFFFRGLSSGRFAVRVLPITTDFEEQIQGFEIYGFNASGRALSDNIQLDFYLNSRKKKNVTVNDVIFAQEIPKDAEVVYEKAVSDLNNKKVDSGIEGLKQAIDLFPSYYSALERLGTELINQQKFAEAREVFNKAVTINTRGFNCWYGLSYTNYVLKMPEPSIEAAEKAVSLNPSSADAFLIYGLSLRQIKKYNEAEKQLKQADKLTNGGSPDIHWNLALLYAHNLNRYKDAADELELYLKTKNDDRDTELIKKLIKDFRQKPNK